jgi:hypothetical protein
MKLNNIYITVVQQYLKIVKKWHSYFTEKNKWISKLNYHISLKLFVIFGADYLHVMQVSKYEICKICAVQVNLFLTFPHFSSYVI